LSIPETGSVLPGSIGELALLRRRRWENPDTAKDSVNYLGRDTPQVYPTGDVYSALAGPSSPRIAIAVIEPMSRMFTY
jgi:hypothetical protein